MLWKFLTSFVSFVFSKVGIAMWRHLLLLVCLYFVFGVVLNIKCQHGVEVAGKSFLKQNTGCKSCLTVDQGLQKVYVCSSIDCPGTSLPRLGCCDFDLCNATVNDRPVKAKVRCYNGIGKILSAKAHIREDANCESCGRFHYGLYVVYTCSPVSCDVIKGITAYSCCTKKLCNRA